MRKIICLIFFILTAVLTGCSDGTSRDRVGVTVEEYEKITYETALVEQGDITPTLNLKLEADVFEKKAYFPFQDNLEVEQIYVSKGDMVQEGDIMISFSSGDIEEQVRTYENRLEEDKLLLEHYTKLAQLDPSMDYSAEIKNINEDIAVAQLYINELNAKLDSYSIKAEGTGMVTLVSDLLSYGTVDSKDNVLTVTYGTGLYHVTTSDDFAFWEGQTFTATYGVASYEMELKEISDSGEDAEGNLLRSLTFGPVDDGYGIMENNVLNMTIEKPVLKNVLYVPKKSVFTVGDKDYVYIMDDKGFRYGVEVVKGSTVGDYTVIEKGLEAGDKVVIGK